jgi:hypothetical protein
MSAGVAARQDASGRIPISSSISISRWCAAGCVSGSRNTFSRSANSDGCTSRLDAKGSSAAKQLRDAGIKADTLQRFLTGGGPQVPGDPGSSHLYIVDESSLASTQQMRDFLNKIEPQDRVLLIGDTRQHQGVDAGKPFEQLQEAGMRTAQLDQIMRQKDPELLKAVEHLSNNETTIGLQMLDQQGRITEIVDPAQRVGAIAKEYAAHPENTLIVSPDNASRRVINQAVRQELQTLGVVEKTDHSMRVLAPRNNMTGADREWAASYQPGDVLHYVRGSKEHGIDARSYARVVTTNPAENLLTVEKQDGQQGGHFACGSQPKFLLLSAPASCLCAAGRGEAGSVKGAVLWRSWSVSEHP